MFRVQTGAFTFCLPGSGSRSIFILKKMDPDSEQDYGKKVSKLPYHTMLNAKNAETSYIIIVLNWPFLR